MIDESWLHQAAPLEEAASLTAQLVSLKSYPGEEGNVQRSVAAWLQREGIDPQIRDLGGDRPNVTGRIENGPGPTLLFNGHVDTVLAADGWSCNPWQGRRDHNVFFGLGACDMKAGVAATMLAVRALLRRRDLWRGTVIFTSVVDEEAYSIGARALVDSRLKADACIVAEPSYDRPTIGAVGKVLVRGNVTGKEAHGSEPERGVNAAVEAARLLSRLADMRLGVHPHLKPTQCVLSFHSGNDQYVITVPAKANFTINRHTVPGETDQSVLAEMDALAESLHSPARFTFSVEPPYYPPWEISRDHALIRQFVSAYAAEIGHDPEFGYSGGVSDANYFAADLGIPTFYFGPRGDRLHQADEWVDLESIPSVVRIYLRLALSLLN